jgi:hypothetical protein
MQMGKETTDFEEEKGGKKMEINLHGAIAPPTSHLLKERLITDRIRLRRVASDLPGEITASVCDHQDVVWLLFMIDPCAVSIFISGGLELRF